MANRILLKRSGVANTAPQAADLEYGELAINYNTGALYFKNSSDAIQVIASTTSGVPGGANTQVQFNDNDLFAGSAAFTFNKTSNLVSMSGNVTATGNISAGNVVTTGLISATGNITGGNLNVSGNIVDTGALFLITGGSGNVTLAPNGSNVVIATTTGANITGTINATGNANVGNLGTTGNITASYFFGNGAFLTGISGGASVAGSNTQVQFNDGGVFGATAGFTFNKTNNAVRSTGSLYAGEYFAMAKTISANLTIQDDVNAFMLSPTVLANGIQIIVPNSSTLLIFG